MTSREYHNIKKKILVELFTPLSSLTGSLLLVSWQEGEDDSQYERGHHYDEHDTRAVEKASEGRARVTEAVAGCLRGRHE